MQMVVGQHADCTDVVSIAIAPALRPLEAVSVLCVIGEVGIDIGDRHQPDCRRVRTEYRMGVAVSVRVGAASHAGADDGYSNRVSQ
jgi:hypothetical protein